MKNIYKSILIILLIINSCFFISAKAQTLPPTNLRAYFIDDVIENLWDKPVNTSGQTPAGLIGYYIYKNGVQIKYIGDPDALFHYDLNTNWGLNVYEVTANYDMTYYGYPGVFQESAPAGPDSIWFYYPCFILPFFENWDMGTFTFYDWEFEPDQGNWKITCSEGNPAPAAIFDSVGSLSNYNYLMKSIHIHVHQINCADYFLEFDYKLNDVSEGGTEKIIPEIFSGGSWHKIDSITNSGSTGWLHKKLVVTDLIEDYFQLGIRVSGENSANIASWYIDNIHVYGICHGPENVQYNTLNNLVNLSWQYPCDSDTGILRFNIYRTNITGTGNFYLIDTTSNLFYSDTVNNGTPGQYRYYISAYYSNPDDPGYVTCEGVSDTLLIYIPLGNPEKQENPAVRVINTGNMLNVTSSLPVETCEIYNLSGVRIFKQQCQQMTNLQIPVAGLPAGLYLLRVTTAGGTIKTIKVILE